MMLFAVIFSYLGLLIATEETHCTTETCKADSFNKIGSEVIFEDYSVKIWNFTLLPNELTDIHRHNCGYHFLAQSQTELEVYDAKGDRAMSFKVEKNQVFGFSIEGEFLVQTGVNDPIRVPRTHAAKNIALTAYNEILFETKLNCVYD